MAVDLVDSLLTYGLEKGFSVFLLSAANVIQFNQIQALIKDRDKAAADLVDTLKKEIDFRRAT